MALMNNFKTIAITAAATVTAALSIGLWIKADLHSEDSNTIIAMVPITAQSSQKVVFAVPPQQDVDRAAIMAYSMWDKINGHMGRSCNKLIPVYADGHLSKFAVEGFNAAPQDETARRYDFSWRKDPLNSHFIYLRNVSYNLQEVAVSNLPGEAKIVYVYPLLKQENLDDINVIGHSLIERFSLREIYGVNRLQDLNLTNIDLRAYDPSITFENWKTC